MKSTHRRQLVFEHYESQVRVERIGKHGSEVFYSWMTISPSETHFPDVEVTPITKSEVLLRLDLLEEHRSKAFDASEKLAINHLFKKTV
tara:strand:- start:145 stop:411 length:267 start_codon:yes stop_codon:yes gene_type:complete